MFDVFMAFIETPLGFFASCLFTIIIGVAIYLLSLQRTITCTCPQHVFRNQDGTKKVIRIRHLESCEARHD